MNIKWITIDGHNWERDLDTKRTNNEEGKKNLKTRCIPSRKCRFSSFLMSGHKKTQKTTFGRKIMLYSCMYMEDEGKEKSFSFVFAFSWVGARVSGKRNPCRFLTRLHAPPLEIGMFSSVWDLFLTRQLSIAKKQTVYSHFRIGNGKPTRKEKKLDLILFCWPKLNNNHKKASLLVYYWILYIFMDSNKNRLKRQYGFIVHQLEGLDVIRRD
jgi:hypothetical protein